MKKRQTGFTLIELLIVIAIILIIAAIAIPNLMKSRMSANEASAVGSVKAVVDAQMSYSTTFPTLGFACDLKYLGPPSGGSKSQGAGLIDGALASGTRSGYKIVLSNCDASNLPVSGYQVTATPSVPNRTGVRTFCSDESGVIRYDASGGPCTPASEPLQ